MTLLIIRESMNFTSIELIHRLSPNIEFKRPWQLHLFNRTKEWANRVQKITFITVHLHFASTPLWNAPQPVMKFVNLRRTMAPVLQADHFRGAVCLIAHLLRPNLITSTRTRWWISLRVRLSAPALLWSSCLEIMGGSVGAPAWKSFPAKNIVRPVSSSGVSRSSSGLVGWWVSPSLLYG